MSDLFNLDSRKIDAEAVGIFALIFIGVDSLIVATSGLVGVAIAYGLVITLLVSARGHVSGVQFNPAIIIEPLVICQMDIANTVGYTITQLVGAARGALALVLLLPKVEAKAEAELDQSGELDSAGVAES
jgi:glycerol uptake facilitator-like aquaporin